MSSFRAEASQRCTPTAIRCDDVIHTFCSGECASSTACVLLVGSAHLDRGKGKAKAKEERNEREENRGGKGGASQRD